MDYDGNNFSKHDLRVNLDGFDWFCIKWVSIFVFLVLFGLGILYVLGAAIPGLM